MRHKVEIPEVQEFSDDLQGASEEIRTSLIKVKKSIESINGMSSFSGKAAKEAKQYFGELHVTILESFQGLFNDLEENLKQHIKTFGSEVDVSDTATIRSNYLQEVKADINEVFEDLTKQDEIIHDTITKVSDISSATPPTFSDVDEWEKKAVREINELDGDLSAFTSAGNEMNVKAIMNRIETAMENATTSEGKARFTNFEGVSLGSELAKLQDYNEDRREVRKEKAKSLADKLSDGGTLSYTEREILYQYIQNVVLDEYARAHVNEISIFLRYDNEKLKEYINEELLASENSLEKEIALFEQYLFVGNERPSDLYGSTTERVALRSYLDVLKNYHAAVNEVKEQIGWDYNEEDPLLARVEFVNFEIKGESQYTGYGHMESLISVAYYQETGDDVDNSRKEFLEAPIRPGYGDKSEVKYYYGQDAVTNRMHIEGQKLEEELDTMTGEFAGSQLLGHALSAGGRTLSVTSGIIMGAGKYLTGKKETENRLKWKNLKEPANTFNLEMQVNTRGTMEPTEDKQVKLHPTDETYEQIERWKAIHRAVPDFPYDAEAITNQNWREMYELFYDNDEELTLDDEDLALYSYMLDGTENKTVLNLINQNK